MKYSVIENCEWNYPDIHEYESGASIAKLYSLRGGIASFQIHLYDLSGDFEVSSDMTGCEIYEEIPVTVEANPGIEEMAEHFPERQAPFRVYDCLKPYRGGKISSDEACASAGLYICVNIPDDFSGKLCGNIEISSKAEKVSVGVEITVSSAPVPAETLKILMGYYPEAAAKYHKVSSPEEFEVLDKKYLKLFRRQHQNRLYIPTPWKKRDGSGKYDFRYFDDRVEKALSLGYNGFNITGVGFRRSWDLPDILVAGLDSRTEEGKEYTKNYLTELSSHLSEKGWLDKGLFALGVADEPNDKNCDTYREFSEFVKKYAPDIPLYDAISAFPVGNALDIYIPRCDEYEKNRDFFENYRKAGKEIWHYVCLFPREAGCINRFLDLPLLSTRYLYWGNYINSLPGYLHWSVNNYQSGSDAFSMSCPKHINADSVSILPPGDDKLVYPGDGEPWMSMRFENHRESAEEYEMLRIIAEDDKALSDALCRECVRGFCDVTYDTEKFAITRRKIIENYEKVYEKRKATEL